MTHVTRPQRRRSSWATSSETSRAQCSVVLKAITRTGSWYLNLGSPHEMVPAGMRVPGLGPFLCYPGEYPSSLFTPAPPASFVDFPSRQSDGNLSGSPRLKGGDSLHSLRIRTHHAGQGRPIRLKRFDRNPFSVRRIPRRACLIGRCGAVRTRCFCYASDEAARRTACRLGT